MKLLEIGRLRWQVLAICDHRDRCQVLDVLVRLGANSHAAARMSRLLRTHVPERGPMFSNEEQVKKLAGSQGIFEFREQPNRGPKLRILFFRDGNRVVVCTHAFQKNQKKTPRGVIEKAEAARKAYFVDKANGAIVIDDAR